MKISDPHKNASVKFPGEGEGGTRLPSNSMIGFAQLYLRTKTPLDYFEALDGCNWRNPVASTKPSD
jgi:hypothetical protein